ncbi:DDHD2 [Symbiodinium sp. CCMP2592]|nr:DDHD2 [Symbiodinium sp. CCMP2592]
MSADSLPDADVTGIDISEGEGPSPSEIPIPNFGFQGIEIDNVLPDRLSTGQDIPMVNSSSSQSREDTSEVRSDIDQSIAPPVEKPQLPSQRVARAKNAAKVPKGSVGQALQQRREQMLGAIEVCKPLEDNIVSAAESSASDVDIQVQQDLADRAVLMATSRSPSALGVIKPVSPASTTSATAPPPPPPPPPPVSSAGIECTPMQPPQYAGDPLLTTSGQDVHSELVLSRTVGGAVSVKLKSWQGRLIMQAAPEDQIQGNIKIVTDLCNESGIQLLPLFELRCFATLMCQYTGDTSRMFCRVKCHESKAHVYWSFDLTDRFVPHDDLSAELRNLYYFAHGSDMAGVQGIIQSRFLAPATLADGPEAVGHYSQATPWSDDMSFVQILDRVTNSAKWACPIITHGFASVPGQHFVLKSGGGEDAQQQCLIHGVVHFKRDHKYVIHSGRSTVAGFTVAVAKQFTPLRDAFGRPLFQVPLTHAQQIQRGMEIFEVPLHRVVSGGTSNWALRQVAHGRCVHWENFRSKQEGVFAGVLMRALRSEQAEQEGTDFVTILNATQKKLHPDAELHDWSARYKTIQKLAEDLVKDFRKHAPVQTNQTLLQRLHALETENAPRSPIPDFEEEDLEAVGDGEATADFRSPAHVFSEEEEEENKDQGPIDAQDTFSQYLPNRDSTLYLENCSLEGHNIKSVNNWLASTAIGKGKNKVIDTAVSEFVAACAKLDDGSRKPVDKIAVEWGLSVSLASKLNEKCLTRLIAGAHLLANQFSADIFVRIRDLLVQFRDRVQLQVFSSIMATRQADELQMHEILDLIGDRCSDGVKGGDYLLVFVQDCGNGLNINVIYMNRLFVMISPRFIQQFIEIFDKCEDLFSLRLIISLPLYLLPVLLLFTRYWNQAMIVHLVCSSVDNIDAVKKLLTYRIKEMTGMVT